MKNAVSFFKVLISLGMCLMAIMGCSQLMAPLSNPGSSSEGAVVLSFSDARTKTIVPTVSLDIASYDISFSRSGQATVNLNGVAGGTAQTPPVYLKPGVWTVTATAKNASGDIIGVGSVEVTVSAGQTVTASMAIQSLIGEGTLTLSANTSALTLSAPSVEGTLTPGSGGSSISLSFVMGTGSASYSGSVSAGAYLLQLELKDGATTLASYVDTVLVVANFPTAGNLVFKPKNGSVVVQLVDELVRAIAISLSGAQASLAVGSTMTVTATPATAVDSYQWYLDGVSIAGATTNAVTVGSGLEEGEYRLTVVVKKGAVYSSESVEFAVTAAGVGSFKAASGGQYHSMIVKTDGTSWACGGNYSGQLGDGTTNNRSIPVQVINDISSVAAGWTHTMMVKTNGTLWACGGNGSGQLGDGTLVNRLIPVQVMSGVASVVAGGFHSMILKTDGTLWACGADYYGQLGDGTTTSIYTPVQVMTDVASVSAGYYYTMIVKTDGTLWACGDNSNGQLGDGTKTSGYSPVQIMTDVAFVSAGWFHTMIVKRDGTLWACGDNGFGCLGDGTTTERLSPVQIMTGVAAVSAGLYHTMILKSDGTLWACGINANGQLGDGSTLSRSTPVQVMSGVASVSAGCEFSMIIRTDGTLWACGTNYIGQLGDGTTTERHTPVQITF